MGSTPSQPNHAPARRIRQSNVIAQLPQQVPRPKVVPQPQQPNQQPVELDWPLPPRDPGGTFRVTRTIDANRYSLAQAQIKISIEPSSESSKASRKTQHNQRNTSDKDWAKKIDSRIFASAHVQSQLTAHFHACFNLATSENIDGVLHGLKITRTEFDVRLKRRLTLVSSAVEEKLTFIIEDTKREQDRLLAHDKERQTLQEERYQEWLQKYIVKLNEWRSIELDSLQTELQEHQQEILAVSQRKIERLTEDANRLKLQILQEEHDYELQRTSTIVATIYDEKKGNSGQHLGSESKTEVNLRIQANVGVMAPGHGCNNDPTT